jgi:hypothetical protein
MIAYTSWHWAAAAYLISAILFVPVWAYIMRHRRREGGN